MVALPNTDKRRETVEAPVIPAGVRIRTIHRVVGARNQRAHIQEDAWKFRWATSQGGEVDIRSVDDPIGQLIAGSLIFYQVVGEHRELVPAPLTD